MWNSVVTSSVSSLPEVVGDAAMLVNPENVFDIARGIREVLLDENLRAELIGKGHLQARRFSWAQTARQVLEIYREVAQAGASGSAAEILVIFANPRGQAILPAAGLPAGGALWKAGPRAVKPPTFHMHNRHSAGRGPLTAWLAASGFEELQYARQRMPSCAPGSPLGIVPHASRTRLRRRHGWQPPERSLSLSHQVQQGNLQSRQDAVRHYWRQLSDSL